MSNMKKYQSLLKMFWNRKTFFFSLVRVVTLLILCNLVAILLGVVSVFLPFSVRCAPQEVLNTRQISIDGGPEGGSTLYQDILSEKKCYSIFRKAYWVNPEWNLEYPAIFSEKQI